jgi:6-phospho-beta-glucosidase
MKLTLIGGGGVRAPLFVASVLRRAETIGLEEICLMDIDAEKLQLLGGLCQELGRRSGKSVQVTLTSDARQALQGAKYVVTSIRVGSDAGRVLDERIALRHGVLGQETTGPGGFAMALRSIPAILEYARLIQEVAPGAWMFNFTNPAGLVTQALRDSGFERTIGICDGANIAQYEIAKKLGVHPNSLRPEVFGLNHLSWTRRVMLDGKDVLPAILADAEYLKTTIMAIFDPQLVRYFDTWLNEYLYYYYYADRAVESISAEEETRGEEILDLNQQLLARLRRQIQEQKLSEALDTYFNYEQRRSSTYMYYARPEAPTPQAANQQKPSQGIDPLQGNQGEGYAGVILDIMEGLETGQAKYIGLNVANQGAIACMRPTDVVEVSCVVENGAIRPLAIGEIPEPQELLMRSVKLYERLTVEAILKRSRETAALALMAHPLVRSYPLAKVLVSEYLKAHAAYIGTWE